MEYIAPLIQTILWVGLIGAIVWRFHEPIYGLLMALQKRVESGSTVRAGPFEIGELRPQEPQKQREKLEAELREALPPPPGAKQTTPPSHTLGVGNRHALYFQAEDLALRAIQAEYGKPISRQVTAGADFGFDGAFTVEGRLNIVEVKFVRNLNSISRLRASVERIDSAVARYNWKNVQLILVVVFEHEDDVARADTMLLDAFKGLSVPLTIRPFSLPELQRRFGLEAEQNG